MLLKAFENSLCPACRFVEIALNLREDLPGQTRSSKQTP